MTIPVIDKFKPAGDFKIIDSVDVEGFEDAIAPDLENFIYITTNGDDANDGRSYHKPVETIARAEAIASLFTTRGVIYCPDGSALNTGAVVAINNVDYFLEWAEVTGDFSGSESGDNKYYMDKHFDLLGVGSGNQMYIREQSGNITIQAQVHDNTVLVIDKLLTGGINFISGATGVLYLRINEVSGSLTINPPAGLKVIGYIEGQEYPNNRITQAERDKLTRYNFPIVDTENDDVNRWVKVAGVGEYSYIDPPMEWKGAWDNAVVYTRGDVVTRGGSTYVLSAAHNSAGYVDIDPVTNPEEWSVLVHNTSGITNIVTIDSNHTATLSEFEGYAHTIFISTATGQIDLSLPDDVIPTSNMFTVKQFSGTTGAVLVGTGSTGRIDGESDHRIVEEEALTCIHIGGNQYRIMSDYMFSDEQNRKLEAFADELTQDGSKFNLSENVFVNPANVVISQNMATGTTLGSALQYSVQGGTPTQQTVDFGTQNIQFTNLTGGKLQAMVSFNLLNSSGFLPDLVTLNLKYTGFTFAFPLTNISPDGGSRILTIDIPNEDYSTIFNTDPTVEIIMNVRGVSTTGTVTIINIINSEKGTLHDAVVNIADTSAANVEARLQEEITSLKGSIDQEEQSFASIIPRISPYANQQVVNPEINVRFLDSTGSDPYPSDIGSMSEVSADNPRFEGGDVALYVAVIPQDGISYILKNITQSTSIPLDNSEPNVDIGESLQYQGNTYFVYRISSLTATDVYEVDNVSFVQVVAWKAEHENIEDDINRIDAELDHAALNLPDAVVEILENDITVTEESNPNINPTDYNKNLGNTNAQTIFYEPNANAPSAGTLTSRPLNENIGDQADRKLIYLNSDVTYTNQAYIWAYDNTTQRDLISYLNGSFFAKVFVPAKSAGSSTETIYPAPNNRVSGSGVWQTIPALIFVNGVPVPEADELFFIRNVPTANRTLTINYRGHANGNIFGTGSTTLDNVGGGSEVSKTFTINDGSETATVEVRYYPNRNNQGRQIRVSVTERVNVGLPTINDIQVILSYAETRTVPATPETTRDVEIERIHSGSQVFAIRPSGTGTLIIVGDITEVDTGYAYTTLFDTDRSGHLTIATESGIFLNYEDFDPISTTVTDLENHASLTQRGLFTTDFSHETIVNLDTQLQVKDDNDNSIRVGTELVLKSANGTYYRLSVENDGTLTTTEIV